MRTAVVSGGSITLRTTWMDMYQIFITVHGLKPVCLSSSPLSTKGDKITCLRMCLRCWPELVRVKCSTVTVEHPVHVGYAFARARLHSGWAVSSKRLYIFVYLHGGSFSCWFIPCFSHFPHVSSCVCNNSKHKTQLRMERSFLGCGGCPLMDRSGVAAATDFWENLHNA